MVTKNFTNFLRAMIGVSSSNTSYCILKAYITDINGNTKLQSSDFSYITQCFTETGACPTTFSLTNFSDISSTSTRLNGLFFGSGKTAPTKDDYYLESPIAYADDGLTMLSKSVVSAPDADTLLVYTYTVKNNSTSPIDISEMAMIMRVKFTDNVTFMWARDTFDTITLEPGEVRSFTMTISV